MSKRDATRSEQKLFLPVRKLQNPDICPKHHCLEVTVVVGPSSIRSLDFLPMTETLFSSLASSKGDLKVGWDNLHWCLCISLPSAPSATPSLLLGYCWGHSHIFFYFCLHLPTVLSKLLLTNKAPDHPSISLWSPEGPSRPSWDPTTLTPPVPV